MSSIQMTPVQTPTGGVNEITAVLLPSLKDRYSKRAARLRQLTEAHAMGDYLGFCAQLAEAQHALLERMPVPEALVAGLAERLSNGQAPLAAVDYPRDRYWQQLLQGLAEQLYPEANPSVRMTLDSLREHTPAQLEQLASALLAGGYEQVGSGQALFLWAALAEAGRALANWVKYSDSAAQRNNAWPLPTCS
jgi:FdhE protein